VFHPHWRQQALSRLDETFDLIIVGGGITGSGILFDASQRGLKALLVERHDFAAGTSSRSSKLIHGGLRYLKQMQFRVTRMACRERDRMLVLNPLLVQPIRFLYPANRGDKVPGWTVDLGLWMYDRLTSRPEKHTHLEPTDVEAMAPGLELDNLDRAMAYTDALTDDALLTLAVAATGFAYGGLALTRAEAVECIHGTDGRLNGIVVRDLESGRNHQVRGHLVINAAGVWSDQVRHCFGFGTNRLRPSRGTHIIIPSRRLPIEAALTVPSPEDGRPVFLIPHPEGVLVGTTDIYHDGDLDDPRPTRQEVSYLLETLIAHFPDNDLSEDDIAAAFAGLRPILDAHTDDPSEASREEDIWEENGLLTVAGGKLTTWRPMAEEAVDEALKHLPEERAKQVAPCLTDGTALASLAPPDLAARLAGAYPLDPEAASGMARRLRGLAWWAPRLARRKKELRPLAEGLDLTAAEVRVHLAFGAVLHLEDLLLRRARVGLWNPARVPELLPLLRPLFAQQLGWNRHRWRREETQLQSALEGWSVAGIRRHDHLAAGGQTSVANSPSEESPSS
jgi:glycerol-3-phosphate dehydrogenase